MTQDKNIAEAKMMKYKNIFPDLPLCAFDEAIIDIINEAKNNELLFGLEYIGDKANDGIGTIVK